jgi:hypothetical protein
MTRIVLMVSLVLSGCVVRDRDTPPVAGTRGTIAVSNRLACAIADRTGAVECWGNSFTTPLRVHDFAGAETLALGGPEVGFAVLSDGSVAEIRIDLAGADPGPALDGVYDLSVGRARACALSGDGAASCWQATTDSAATVAGVGDAVRISVAPQSDETCAVLADGTAQCWGWDEAAGEAGEAQAVPDLEGVVEIVQGALHACARLDDGRVLCWGENEHGELGDGTTNATETPVAVLGIENAVQIAAGENHTCARIEDGTLRCWGFDHYGQLGDGEMSDEPVSRPVDVYGLEGVYDVALGGQTTCACATTGVYCWGDNLHGQLGNGTNTASAEPEPVEL